MKRGLLVSILIGLGLCMEGAVLFYQDMRAAGLPAGDGPGLVYPVGDTCSVRMYRKADNRTVFDFRDRDGKRAARFEFRKEKPVRAVLYSPEGGVDYEQWDITRPVKIKGSVDEEK